jgi:hypothetical protein
MSIVILPACSRAHSSISVSYRFFSLKIEEELFTLFFFFFFFVAAVERPPARSHPADYICVKYNKKTTISQSYQNVYLRTRVSSLARVSVCQSA